MNIGRAARVVAVLYAFGVAACKQAPTGPAAAPARAPSSPPEKIVARSAQLEIVELASDPPRYLVRAPDGAFSVEVPAPNPQLETAHGGDGATTTVLFASPEGTLGIGTNGTSSLPRGASALEIRAMFDRARARAVGDQALDLVEEHDITVAGAPARVFDVRGSVEGLAVRAREWIIYVERARATVVVQVVGTETTAEAKFEQATELMKTFTVAAR